MLYLSIGILMNICAKLNICTLNAPTSPIPKPKKDTKCKAISVVLHFMVQTLTMLKINNIQKTIDNRKIINNISFSLEQGKILAILGESGSGKTTLLKLVAGLLEADSGSLLLQNEPIIPPSQKLIAGHPEIKLVRQDYGLFPNISLRENIEYELRFYEVAYRNARVDKLLTISKLTHVAHKLPREVSGGEQQRAVIARAIAEQPLLLLLDEPFSHLDINNKQRLKDEVASMVKEEGIACIFVTHEVSDAFGMADQLMILKEGEILQIDSPQNVYYQPIDDYTAHITGKCNIVEAADTKMYLRPEKIKLQSEETHTKGIIKNVTFCGFYYEILLETENQKFMAYSLDKYSIGESFYLNFE